MSDDKFDWKSEEESWEEPTPEVATAVFSSRRRWFLILLLLCIVAGGGFLFYRQLQQQVTAVTASTTDEVITAHRLLFQAAQTGDMDLFVSLLSAADPFWADTQQAMLDYDLALNRAPLGLWIEKTGIITDVQVTLSPDLTQAEVIDLVSYLVEPTSGVTQTVWLRRTAVYVYDDDRWLLSPLPEDQVFWGKWMTIEGEYLSLIFAQRDAALGERLAPELDAVVRRLCQETAVSCPPAFHFQLRLARDTPALLRLRESYARLNVSFNLPQKIHLDTPSPTLVGWPVNDAGYEALFRAYANWVAALTLFNLETGQINVYGRMPPSLAEMGLQWPPPLGYELQTRTTSSSLSLPAQDVLVLCNATPEETKLWRYDPQQETWTVALPFAGSAVHILQVLPWVVGEGVLFDTSEVVDGQMHYRTYLWQQGTMQLVVDVENPYLTLSGYVPELTGDGRYLPVYGYTVAAETGSHVRVFDLQQCDVTGCAPIATADATYFAPDGRFRIIMGWFDQDWPAQLTLVDAAGNPVTTFDAGWSPLWLDETTFVYVRSLEGVAEFVVGQRPVQLVAVQLAVETMTAAAAIETQTVIVSSQDLYDVLQRSPAVASHMTGANIFVNGLYRRPGHPGQFIMSVIGFSEFGIEHQFYFAYEVATGDLSLLLDSDDTAGTPPLFSADGRFLSMLTINRANVTLYVHDLEEGQTTAYVASIAEYPLPVYDWSADNQWLVMAEDRVLRFIAPATGDERRVHNPPGCYTAVWVNK